MKTIISTSLKNLLYRLFDFCEHKISLYNLAYHTKRQLILPMAVLIISINSLSFNASAYNIKNALDDTKERNQAIKALDENIVSAKVGVNQSVTTFFPDISLKDTRSKYTFRNGDLDLNTTYKALAFEKTLFKSGNSFAQYAAARNSLLAVENAYINSVQNIYLNAVIAFEQHLSDLDIVDFTKKREELLQNQLELNKTRFEYQDVPKTDVLRAQASYADAIASRKTAVGNALSSKAVLEGIVYNDISETIIDLHLNNLWEKLPENQLEFMQKVIENNPQIKASYYQYEAAKVGVYVSVTEILPTIVGSVELFKSTEEQITRTTSEGTFASITFRVPLLPSGGSDFLAVKQAKSDKSRALANLKATRRDVEASAVRAWNDYISAQAVQEAAYQALLAEKETLEGFQEEARVGARDIIEVLDVESRYFNALVNHRRAIQNRVNAAFNILALSGELYDFSFAALVR